jgi:hypothetical protein
MLVGRGLKSVYDTVNSISMFQDLRSLITETKKANGSSIFPQSEGLVPIDSGLEYANKIAEA